MSERLLKTLRKSGDFQAEYEGSIPFTRSIAFSGNRHRAVLPARAAGGWLHAVSAGLGTGK